MHGSVLLTCRRDDKKRDSYDGLDTIGIVCEIFVPSLDLSLSLSLSLSTELGSLNPAIVGSAD